MFSAVLLSAVLMGLRAVTGFAVAVFAGAEALVAFFDGVTLVVFFAVAIGTRWLTSWCRRGGGNAAHFIGRHLPRSTTPFGAALLLDFETEAWRASVSCSAFAMEMS